MSSSHSGAATLPKGFRYHDPDSEATQLPKTPEPYAPHDHDDMQHAPSPPRQRFRLKRRVASHLLNAPTQQFLASVAAADVPIPSIEEPDSAPVGPPPQRTRTPLGAQDESQDLAAPDMLHPGQRHRRYPGQGFTSMTAPALRNFASPPRTPAPLLSLSPVPSRYPDWSIDAAFSSGESTPECESSRPSTARSTQTEASLFSRFSITSDEMQCDGFEDKLGPPDAPSHPAMSASDADNTATTSEHQPRYKQRRAVWTKAMNDHLWSTYTAYLQDPRVTPVRTSKSGIPPQGVCLRVARQAKKSWRGLQVQTRAQQDQSAGQVGSGSITPTTGQPTTFLQWPHTCAATRARLRELCRLNAACSSARAMQYITHSPTPFGRTATRYWNRRLTPTPGAVFSSKDMSLSLALSTSDSMQPQGPLAQLARASPDDVREVAAAVSSSSVALSTNEASLPTPDAPAAARRRLASPFVARSYGPSCSTSDALGPALSSGKGRNHHTHGHHRNLQSPVRLTRSRSNTQKRRSRQSSPEPRKTKRPSLASDLWTEPLSKPTSSDKPTEVPSLTIPELPPMSYGVAGNARRHGELFVPRTAAENLADLFGAPQEGADGRDGNSLQNQSRSHLAAPDSLPPRLGSPFSASSSSYSFPNRSTKLEKIVYGEVGSRPFATIQQLGRVGQGHATPARDLAGRLAYIDGRLKEFRQRDPAQRSESPF